MTRPAPASPGVLQMAAPLVISFWMRAAVTLVDTIYAALLGDHAVAAVGLTIPFEFLMVAVWVGLSTGLTSALARAFGERQERKIAQYNRVAWMAVCVAAPLFAAIGAGIWFFAPYLALEPHVRDSFRIFGTVLIGGSAFTTFWSVIPDSVVKAHHDTRSTMWAGIWSNLINVGLNTLFLFAFHWGVLGIALSTVLGRLGGLAYALFRAARLEAARRARGEFLDTAIDPAPVNRVLGLAVPSSLTFLLMAAESGLINGLLARAEHATEAIAAYSIHARIVLFALQPVIATGVAMLPFAARRFGEGDVAGVRRGLRQALIATGIYAALVAAPILVPLAPWIAARLADAPLTREYTIVALRLAPLACLVGTPFLLCRPVFEAMNRGRPGLTMAVLRYVVLTAPLAWLGMYVATRTGVPPLYGLLVGLLGAATIASAAFLAWTRQALVVQRG